MQGGSVDFDLVFGIDQGHVGRFPSPQRAVRQAEDAGRAACEGGDQLRQRQQAVVVQPQGQADAGFQADYARRGRQVILLLVGHVLGQVIGRNGVDRAVPQAGAQRLDVRRRAQRRVDLGVGVVTLDGLVGQREVMRTGLGGHLQALVLGSPQEADRFRAAHVLHVQMRTAQRRQLDVAVHDGALRRRRRPRQSQDGGHRAFMHDAVTGQHAVFAMRQDRQAEHAAVFHGAAHQPGAGDALRAIRQGHDASLVHAADFGQRLALQARGRGADRVEPGAGGHGGASQNVFGHRRRVVHRLGIRHHRHRGKAAGSSGGQPAGHRLAVLVARLAEVDVHVDEARRHDPAGGLHDAEPTAFGHR